MSTTGLVRFASAYVDTGLSVLPLNSNRIPDVQRLPLLYDEDGSPLLNRRGNHKRGWKEFQYRLPTHDEISAWFEKDSGCIGLVCGVVSGGLFVIDFDHEAEDVFPLFVESIADLNLDLTVVKTGKGYHVYLRCPEGVPGCTVLARNAEGQILIETKGEGGCVTTIPSVHPLGMRYKLESGSLLNIPEVTAGQRDAILDAARRFNKKDAYKPKLYPTLLNPNQVNDRRVRRYVDVVLASVTDDLARVVSGGRNNQLFRSAARFGSFIAGGLLDGNTAMVNLERACVSNGLIEEDGYWSFEATVESGIASGIAEPITERDVKSRLYFNEEEHGMLPSRLREIAPAITPDEIAEVAEIVRKLEQKSYWRGYHDAMSPDQRENWQIMVPAEAIDLFELGYDNERNAFTIPFPNAQGNIVNIEYRGKLGTTYEQDVVPSFFHALSPIMGNEWQDDLPTVLFPNAFNAMWAYLRYGHLRIDNRPLQFAALPQYKLSSDAIDFLDANDKIWLVASQRGMQCRGIRSLLPYVSVMRLARPFSELVTQIRDTDFLRYLHTGVRGANQILVGG